MENATFNGPTAIYLSWNDVEYHSFGHWFLVLRLFFCVFYFFFLLLLSSVCWRLTAINAWHWGVDWKKHTSIHNHTLTFNGHPYPNWKSIWISKACYVFTISWFANKQTNGEQNNRQMMNDLRVKQFYFIRFSSFVSGWMFRSNSIGDSFHFVYRLHFFIVVRLPKYSKWRWFSNKLSIITDNWFPSSLIYFTYFKSLNSPFSRYFIYMWWEKERGCANAVCKKRINKCRSISICALKVNTWLSPRFSTCKRCNKLYTWRLTFFILQLRHFSSRNSCIVWIMWMISCYRVE